MQFDLELRAKPVLKWAGGKSGPLAQMLAHFPTEFNRYVEPFLGGGAVFFALKPGVPALLADSNPELVRLYEVLREEPQELMAQLDTMAAAYSESYYYDLRQATPNDRVGLAARTVFLNKTGFNGLFRLNSKGGFNVPFGKRPVCPALYERENVLAVSQRLAGAKLVCADFESVLSETGPGDFAYCDPPYEPLSRTSAFNSYVAGGFSQDDQTRLEKACAAAVARGARVAVSNSTAPFIASLYQGWTVQTIQAKRAINSKGANRGAIAELLALR